MANAKWLSMDQLCEELGESRDTLNKWKAKGKFPKYLKKPNGRLWFKVEDVYAWLDDLTVSA
jgi:predicted site-specific integrase-resolvase